MTQWSGAVFGKTIARAALGELGDKTFYLIVGLMLWEPMRGIFAGRSLWPRFCVFCGAYGALLTRIILIAFNITFMDESWGFLFDFIAAFVLLVLNIVSVRDLRREGTFDKTSSEEDPLSQPKTEGEDAAAAGNPFQIEGEGAATGENYGAASAEKVAPKNLKPTWMSLILGSRTFVIAYFATFLVDINDKSPGSFLEGTHSGFDFAIGALIGQLLALFVSMVFAFALAAVFEAKQLSMATVLLTGALFLTEISQAVMGLGPLQPQSRAASFLSLRVSQ